MGPCDSILLQSSSPEKVAKDTVIAYTLEETKVKHIQVKFFEGKDIFLTTLPYYFIDENRAFGNK